MKKFLRYSIPVFLLAITGGAFAANDNKQIRHDFSKYLIERSWSNSIHGQKESRPWFWIDAHPAARLDFPVLDKNIIVLSGEDKAARNYAPYWHEGSARAGEMGVSYIQGVPENFGFLKHLKSGDDFVLTTTNGQRISYKIHEIIVTEADTISAQNGDSNVLILGTRFNYKNWNDRGNIMNYLVVAYSKKEKARHPDVASL